MARRTDHRRRSGGLELRFDNVSKAARILLGLFAALAVFCVSAPQASASLPLKASAGSTGFQPPCAGTGQPAPCSPFNSTFMGYSHALPSGTVNGGLQVQSSGVAAWYPNENGVSGQHYPLSWTFFGQFTYDSSVAQQGAGSNSNDHYIAANCKGTSCSTFNTGFGGIRYFGITNPFNTSSQANESNEFVFQGFGALAAAGTTPLYIPPATNNYWSPPATLTSEAGCNDTTNGFLCQTGIILTPGVNYTFVISQYGLESANMSEGIAGLMAIEIMDSKGNQAPGSPVVTSSDNLCQPIASCITKGFYNANTANQYNAASVIGPMIQTIGTGTNLTTPQQFGMHGPFSNFGMVYGVMPHVAPGNATPVPQVIQDLATSKVDPAVWATSPNDYNGTLHSLYRLNDTNWTDSGPNQYSPLIAVNTGYAPTIASPIIPPLALVLNDYGPGQVYSIDYGQHGAGAVGTINFDGTYNPSLRTGIECQVLNSSGAPVSVWTKMASSGGVFSGHIGNILNGNGYMKQCRFTASRKYSFRATSPVGVGLVIGFTGQSQIDVPRSPQTSITSGTGSNLVAAQPFTVVSLSLNDLLNTSGSVVSNYGTGSIGILTVDSNNTPGFDCTTGCPAGSSNSQPIGDAFVAFVNNLELESNVAGMPVEIVTFPKSGQTVDNFVFDFFPQTNQFTTGTTFSGQTLAFSPAAIPNANLVAGFFKSIKEGSVVMTDDNGVVVATDTPAYPFHFNATCTWTASSAAMNCTAASGVQTAINAGATVYINAAAGLAANATVASVGTTWTTSAPPTITVTLANSSMSTVSETGKVVEFTTYGQLYAPGGSAIGSLNYVTPQFSATFGSAPTGHLHVAWTAIQDTTGGSSTQKIPYAGYGTSGDMFNPRSGYVTQTLLSGVDSRFTAMIFSQCTSNSGEVSSVVGNGATAGLASMNAKWNYFFTTLLPKWKRWDPNTPIIAAGYQRDTGGTSTTATTITAGCTYFMQQYPNQTAGSGVPLHMYYGGEYGDLNTQEGNNLWESPHPIFGPDGGAREGRRWADAVNSVLVGQNARQGKISSINFKGCPASCDYTKIDINFDTSALGGVALATCGPNLVAPTDIYPAQGGKNGGVNNCVATTWNSGNADKSVKGFRIGMGPSQSSPMYNDYGLDHGTFTGLIPAGVVNAITNTLGSTGPGGTNDKAFTFQCTLIAATTVECANTGSWDWSTATTTMYVSYDAEGPASSSGHITGFQITSPGSGQANGTYGPTAVTLTGGSCGSSGGTPTLMYTISGGALVDVWINSTASKGSVGYNCTIQPTFTVAQGGTPGTFTINGGFGSSLNLGLYQDMRDVGETLYTTDQSTGYYYNSSTTYYEPGLPVRRCVVPQLVGGTSITC